MGLFDLLFPDSSKKIYKEDFKSALHQIPELSDSERAYVLEAFKDVLSDGLSKYELEKKCSELMHKPGDALDPYEVEQIRNKISKYLE